MKNPPDGWPRITPAVFYDDAAVAIGWLARAFGFAVQERVENDRGQIVHSQLVLNGGLIMVGQAGLSSNHEHPRSPKAVGGANTQVLAVFVDDADAHCERARGSGAVITTEPATRPNRRLRTTARIIGWTEPTRPGTSRGIIGGSCSACADSEPASAAITLGRSRSRISRSAGAGAVCLCGRKPCGGCCTKQRLGRRRCWLWM